MALKEIKQSQQQKLYHTELADTDVLCLSWSLLDNNCLAIFVLPTDNIQVKSEETWNVYKPNYRNLLATF